jgi:hypothetical protein
MSIFSLPAIHAANSHYYLEIHNYLTHVSEAAADETIVRFNQFEVHSILCLFSSSHPGINQNIIHITYS